MNLRLRLLPVLLAVLVGLVVVAVSGAALTSPFYVSPAQQSANMGDVSVSPEGKAFVVWQRFYQPTGDEVVAMRTRTAAGTFGTPQILSTGGHDALPPKVATWSGGCVVVWQLNHGNASATTPIQGKTCASDGALGPLFTVAPHPGGSFSYEFAYPNVATDAAGDAFFTWGASTRTARNASIRAGARPAARSGRFLHSRPPASPR
jgi:hypothetical protein